jgi:hypothetical protein
MAQLVSAPTGEHWWNGGVGATWAKEEVADADNVMVVSATIQEHNLVMRLDRKFIDFN